MRITWSDVAEADLDDLYNYIARDVPYYAERWRAQTPATDLVRTCISRSNRVGFNPTHIPAVTMRSTQQFSITLPNEMAEAVRAKVAAGEYATESEVIRDGLRALLVRDRALEDWLRSNVAAAYDALKADPSRAVSVDRVRARLAAEKKKAAAKV